MRRVPRDVLRGFWTFVEGARLLWRVKSLRVLAGASALSTALWIAALVLLFEWIEQDTLGWFRVVLMPLCMFVALFAFPVLGPVSVAFQQRAGERARSVLAGIDAPDHGLSWWFWASLRHFIGIYPRFFVVAASLWFAALVSYWVVPDEMPVIERVVQVLVLLTLLALGTLVRSLDDARSVAAVPRRRWAELFGYVAGAWCLTLFGLAPWFAVLGAVSAEIFRARLRDPDFRIDWQSASEREKTDSYRRIPDEVVKEIRRHFERIRSSMVFGARLPEATRFEYIPLIADRSGEQRTGALLLVDEDGRFELKGAVRYWVMVSLDVPFDTRRLPRGGDVYAGPFEL